jgi:hypothetical protein
MPKFSTASIEKLNTCHPDLIRLFTEVVKHYDCTILCGQRGQAEQDEAFRTGKSQLVWPNSKHNQRPSLAVDVAPYPIDWKDRERFYHFAGFVKAMAITMGIKIRHGGDWDGDNDLKDQNFFDLPHFELL